MTVSREEDPATAAAISPGRTTTSRPGCSRSAQAALLHAPATHRDGKLIVLGETGTLEVSCLAHRLSRCICRGGVDLDRPEEDAVLSPGKTSRNESQNSGHQECEVPETQAAAVHRPPPIPPCSSWPHPARDAVHQRVGAPLHPVSLQGRTASAAASQPPDTPSPLFPGLV